MLPLCDNFLNKRLNLHEKIPDQSKSKSKIPVRVKRCSEIIIPIQNSIDMFQFKENTSLSYFSIKKEIYCGKTIELRFILNIEFGENWIISV